MDKDKSIAVYREYDQELLGYLVDSGGHWQAQTIFGATIKRCESRRQAEDVLHDQGLGYMRGVWQYRDPDDGDWHPCVLKEAYKDRVVVVRTNDMGYQDPEDYKIVILRDPSEDVLVKVS